MISLGLGLGLNSATSGAFRSTMFQDVAKATAFQTSDAGPMFTDPQNIPANTSSLTFRAVLIMDTENPSNAPDIFSIGGSQLRLAAVVSQARLRLTVKDNAGVTLLNFNTATNIIPAGVQHELLLKVDLQAGRALLYLDGAVVPVIDETFTSVDPVWSVSSAFTMLGGVQFVGQVEAMQLWLNEATVDNVVPTSPPYKTVSGSSADVNADSWKTGVDAT